VSDEHALCNTVCVSKGPLQILFQKATGPDTADGAEVVFLYQVLGWFC
jgi:hypothetical protein